MGRTVMIASSRGGTPMPSETTTLPQRWIAALEVLFALIAWFAGLVAASTISGHVHGVLGEGELGIAPEVVLFSIPFGLVVAHLVSGWRLFFWLLVLVALLQTAYGFLSLVGVLTVPPLFTLLSAACGFFMQRGQRRTLTRAELGSPEDPWSTNEH